MKKINIAKKVLIQEANALISASERLKNEELDTFAQILNNLLSTGGNLVVCGVGKSGIIATKIASTFSSLGLPSFFLHPTDALHGDLGRLTSEDALIYVSNSGTTEEILKLDSFIKNNKAMKIGLLGNINSPISERCEVVFDCSVESEACLNNQAPTTSTTMALAMGDALAVIYESMVDLSKEGFAENHPGGILGKSLRMQVKDLMWKKSDCPYLKIDSTLQDVILEMTKYPVGGCAIVDSNEKLLGILVEGDIRRTFVKKELGLQSKVIDIMNNNPIKIYPEESAINAMTLMEQRDKQIDILPVVNSDQMFLGFVRLHDLLKEGFLKK